MPFPTSKTSIGLWMAIVDGDWAWHNRDMTTCLVSFILLSEDSIASTSLVPLAYQQRLLVTASIDSGCNKYPTNVGSFVSGEGASLKPS